MPRVKLVWPLIAIHGAVNREDPYYFRTQKDGTVIVCKKPPKGLPRSPAQIANQERFAREYKKKKLNKPSRKVRGAFEDTHNKDAKQQIDNKTV